MKKFIAFERVEERAKISGRTYTLVRIVALDEIESAAIVIL